MRTEIATFGCGGGVGVGGGGVSTISKHDHDPRSERYPIKLGRSTSERSQLGLRGFTGYCRLSTRTIFHVESTFEVPKPSFGGLLWCRLVSHTVDHTQYTTLTELDRYTFVFKNAFEIV